MEEERRLRVELEAVLDETIREERTQVEAQCRQLLAEEQKRREDAERRCQELEQMLKQKTETEKELRKTQATAGVAAAAVVAEGFADGKEDDITMRGANGLSRMRVPPSALLQLRRDLAAMNESLLELRNMIKGSNDAVIASAEVSPAHSRTISATQQTYAGALTLVEQLLLRCQLARHEAAREIRDKAPEDPPPDSAPPAATTSKEETVEMALQLREQLRAQEGRCLDLATKVKKYEMSEKASGVTMDVGSQLLGKAALLNDSPAMPVPGSPLQFSKKNNMSLPIDIVPTPSSSAPPMRHSDRSLWRNDDSDKDVAIDLYGLKDEISVTKISNEKDTVGNGNDDVVIVAADGSTGDSSEALLVSSPS